MKYLLPIALFGAFALSGCFITRMPGAKSAKGNDKNDANLKPATYSTLSSTSSSAQLDYISLYKDAAMSEMERGGVPASIILAQGLLESAAGQSDLAREANNHFGIKCGGSAWTGQTYYKKDDDRDESNQLKESCFRRYNTVAESYFDHAEFLRDPRKYNRYGFLFNLDRTDYKAWARGLQSSGYATSGTYANQLIDLIERYRLSEYDRPAGVTPNPSTSPGSPVVVTGPDGQPQPAPLTTRVGRVNDVKVILSRENETLDDIARAYRIQADNVVNYNDRGYPPGVRLKPGTRIYIQNKKDKWRGRATEHFVREGQTMFDISQQYGIKIDKLRQRNGLQAGQEPAIGEKIRLKGSIKKGEAVRLRDTSLDPLKPDQQPVRPTAPGNDKMTTGDELPFEIGGDDPVPVQPQPTTPPVTPPVKPYTKPPSTTGTPYPPADPTPNQPYDEYGQNQPPVVNPTPPQVPAGYHYVVKGDTLYNIARRYGTTVARIKQLNRMTDDSIKLGQTLKVN